MANKFGKNYPVVGKTNDRERLLFVAAAGLAFSLFIILIVVFQFKDPASAREEVSSLPPEIPSDVGTITLLTPDRAVKAGTRLADVSFKEIYWPRNQVPDAAIRDIAEVRNMFAKIDLAAGVPLQRRHLTREQNNVSLPLTPGNRAVAIQINAETSVEEHAKPGTHVDVVLTYYEDGNLTSKVIVQNARVLSLGGETAAAGKAPSNASRLRAGRQSKTITLDVAPNDALKILTSKKLGDISLMMRNDTGPMQVTEVPAQDIAGGNKGRKNRVCKKGTVRIQGENFILNCDGSMMRMMDSDEP